MNHNTWVPTLPKNLEAKLSSLILIVFDVDGVLTDGRLYYGEQGESLKVFHVRDGVGLKLLKVHGFEVAIISAKSSLPLSKRMSDLGIEHFFPGATDKRQTLNALMNKLNVSSSQVLYVGDDVIDLPVRPLVGVFVAPRDAHPLAQQKADWVTLSLGGEGVAREVSDSILNVKGDLSTLYQLGQQPEFESGCYAKPSEYPD